MRLDTSPRSSPLKSRAPSAPTSDGHSTAPPATVSPNPVKIQSCFGSNPFSRVGTRIGHPRRPNPGQYLRQLVDGPILDQLLRKIEELPDLQSAAASRPSRTRRLRSFPARTQTRPPSRPATTRPHARGATPARSSPTQWRGPSLPSGPPPPTVVSPWTPADSGPFSAPCRQPSGLPPPAVPGCAADAAPPSRVRRCRHLPPRAPPRRPALLGPGPVHHRDPRPAAPGSAPGR